MTEPTDELIVCTRNRPLEIERCLVAISLASLGPSSIHIVDASDDAATEDVVSELNKNSDASYLPITYSRHQPGLPEQRNFAIEQSLAEVIHFLDDDTVIESDYFKEVMRFFSDDRDKRVGGVSGRITNLPPHRPSAVNRLFYLDGDEGKILPSGVNILPFDSLRPVRVDWLTGCAMSYRREALDEQRFDEHLSGYALGEDVDLSQRVAQQWELWSIPDARVAHLQSESGRWSERRLIRTELLHRYRRVQSHIGRQRERAFWWSCVGMVLICIGRIAIAIAQGKSPLERLRQLWWTAGGVLVVVQESG